MRDTEEDGTKAKQNSAHMKRLASHLRHNETTTNGYLPTQGTQFLL